MSPDYPRVERVDTALRFPPSPAAGAQPVGWLGDLADEPTPLVELGRRAAREALRQAGFSDGAAPPALAPRFGCSVGTSKGDLNALDRAKLQHRLTGQVDERLWHAFWPNSLATSLAAELGLSGPSACPIGACATGLLAIVQAAHWLVDGTCDLALAGSADASLVPTIVASYQRLGVLAPADAADPRRAVRPFAADRQGFVIGEGAGMFVLETAEHARRRGAVPLAELAGWALAGDACGLVSLSAQPDALVHCLRTALEQAATVPAAVGHVNCHGTATPANDPWETAALRGAFGTHADRLRLTANKSMIGHLLGAAGSVELGFALLALRDQFVPPTRNLIHPDGACDLNYTPHVGVKAAAEAALKLSIGFGGHLAAVVLRRPK